MRGEKAAGEKYFRGGAGSPPLARGKAVTGVTVSPSAGITPACAGKSSSSRFQGHFRGDHPRLRGEKLVRIHHHLAIQGSPPLARGKVYDKRTLGGGPGITPACAGKRSPGRTAPWPARDHPRLRGEKEFVAFPRVLPRGSPPLARGKGSLDASVFGHHRITPACAGKRPSVVPLVGTL